MKAKLYRYVFAWGDNRFGAIHISDSHPGSQNGAVVVDTFEADVPEAPGNDQIIAAIEANRAVSKAAEIEELKERLAKLESE